jgi:hypothetical protein
MFWYFCFGPLAFFGLLSIAVFGPLLGSMRVLKCLWVGHPVYARLVLPRILGVACRALPRCFLFADRQRFSGLKKHDMLALQYRAHTGFSASNGRPATLSDAERDALVHCINDGYLEHNSWTMTEISARTESVYYK